MLIEEISRETGLGDEPSSAELFQREDIEMRELMIYRHKHHYLVIIQFPPADAFRIFEAAVVHDNGKIRFAVAQKIAGRCDTAFSEVEFYLRIINAETHDHVFQPVDAEISHSMERDTLLRALPHRVYFFLEIVDSVKVIVNSRHDPLAVRRESGAFFVSDKNFKSEILLEII